MPLKRRLRGYDDGKGDDNCPYNDDVLLLRGLGERQLRRAGGVGRLHKPANLPDQELHSICLRGRGEVPLKRRLRGYDDDYNNRARDDNDDMRRRLPRLRKPFLSLPALRKLRRIPELPSPERLQRLRTVARNQPVRLDNQRRGDLHRRLPRDDAIRLRPLPLQQRGVDDWRAPKRGQLRPALRLHGELLLNLRKHYHHDYYNGNNDDYCDKHDHNNCPSQYYYNHGNHNNNQSDDNDYNPS
jgi:hypothetical protein